jgi:hypothetical protein
VSDDGDDLPRGVELLCDPFQHRLAVRIELGRPGRKEELIGNVETDPVREPLDVDLPHGDFGVELVRQAL